MKRLAAGVVLMFFFFLVMSRPMQSGNESDVAVTFFILFMLPGILFFGFGIRAIVRKQEESRRLEQEQVRKTEEKLRHERKASCSHSFSPWSFKTVRPYYCGSYYVSTVAKRVCLNCGTTETCLEHDLRHISTEGPLYDSTTYHRCANCGYEHSIDFNI